MPTHGPSTNQEVAEHLLIHEQSAHQARMRALDALTEEAISSGAYFDHPDTTETR
ncbi:MAG: hypothetical protein HLX51_03355 [Micrococcaceae bacterium]|nr:hypothetical protein [Micrococcaceae bacterium]